METTIGSKTSLRGKPRYTMRTTDRHAWCFETCETPAEVAKREKAMKRGRAPSSQTFEISPLASRAQRRWGPDMIVAVDDARVAAAEDTPVRGTILVQTD